MVDYYYLNYAFFDQSGIESFCNLQSSSAPTNIVEFPKIMSMDNWFCNHFQIDAIWYCSTEYLCRNFLFSHDVSLNLQIYRQNLYVPDGSQVLLISFLCFSCIELIICSFLGSFIDVVVFSCWSSANGRLWMCWLVRREKFRQAGRK